MRGFGLVIFDCDGVLVDSERLSLAAAVEALAREGLAIDAAEAARRYLGRSAAFLRADAETRLGRPLAPDFSERLGATVLDRFRQELKPIAHARAAVETVAARCVASSSTHERIRLSLDLTGLGDLFADRVFSATDVARGKPAPDMHLLAAARCGTAPGRCLVIEDSEAGIAAARAAGMAALGFLGGSHVSPATDGPKLVAAGAHGVFADMRLLPAAIEGLSAGN